MVRLSLASIAAENASILDGHVPRASLRDVRLMSDNDDCVAGFVKAFEELHNIVAGVAIKISRRLVGQQDGGIGYEGARHRHALALAAGQLIRFVIHPVAQSDEFEHFRRAAMRLRPGLAAVKKRQLNVFEGACARQQVECLKNKSNLLIAHPCQFIIAHVRNVFAIEHVFSLVRNVQAAEDVHQRALAAARCAHDCNHFSALDVEAHTIERMDRRVANIVGFPKARAFLSLFPLEGSPSTITLGAAGPRTGFLG